MKYIVLLMCLVLSGCVGRVAYTDSYVSHRYGCVDFTDQYGTRNVCSQYYYDSTGSVVYWDNRFGIWVGRSGYYYGGVYRRGYWPGYSSTYHSGYYRSAPAYRPVVPHNTYRGGHGRGHR